MNTKTLAVAILTLLAVACSKVTVENYDKLKTGMRYEEAKQLLGAPDKCSEVLVIKSCVWGDDKRHISINFIGDQAVVFSAENIR